MRLQRSRPRATRACVPTRISAGGAPGAGAGAVRRAGGRPPVRGTEAVCAALPGCHRNAPKEVGGREGGGPGEGRRGGGGERTSPALPPERSGGARPRGPGKTEPPAGPAPPAAATEEKEHSQPLRPGPAGPGGRVLLPAPGWVPRGAQVGIPGDGSGGCAASGPGLPVSSPAALSMQGGQGRAGSSRRPGGSPQTGVPPRLGSPPFLFCTLPPPPTPGLALPGAHIASPGG